MPLASATGEEEVAEPRRQTEDVGDDGVQTGVRWVEESTLLEGLRAGPEGPVDEEKATGGRERPEVPLGPEAPTEVLGPLPGTPRPF